MPTPEEIRSRVSVLMRVFHNSGAGPAGWEALARWTLERETSVADNLKQEMLDRAKPFARRSK